MTLLDKSGRIKGKHHSPTKDVELWFTFGGNTSASKAITNQLNKVAKDENLKEKSKEIIKDWITNEVQCLVTGSILDHWSSSEALLLRVAISNIDKKEFDGKFPQLKKINVPDEEIQIFSNAIANHVKSPHRG